MKNGVNERDRAAFLRACNFAGYLLEHVADQEDDWMKRHSEPYLLREVVNQSLIACAKGVGVPESEVAFEISATWQINGDPRGKKYRSALAVLQRLYSKHGMRPALDAAATVDGLWNLMMAVNGHFSYAQPDRRV